MGGPFALWAVRMKIRVPGSTSNAVNIAEHRAAMTLRAKHTDVPRFPTASPKRRRVSRAVVFFLSMQCQRAREEGRLLPKA